MNNTIYNLANIIPSLLEHTNLTLVLKGWPAAFTISALAFSGVAVYAIKTYQPNNTNPEDYSA